MAAQLEAKGEKCYRFQRVDAYDGVIAALTSSLEGRTPPIEVETHWGGQPLYPYLFGVE